MIESVSYLNGTFDIISNMEIWITNWHIYLCKPSKTEQTKTHMALSKHFIPARSPVYSHVCATIEGLHTIRAFESQKIFVKEFYLQQDLHTSAWFTYNAANRWFAVCLDCFVAVFITVTAFGCVAIADSKLWRIPWYRNRGHCVSQLNSLKDRAHGWSLKRSQSLRMDARSLVRYSLPISFLMGDVT